MKLVINITTKKWKHAETEIEGPSAAVPHLLKLLILELSRHCCLCPPAAIQEVLFEAIYQH